MLPVMHPDEAGVDIGAEEIFVAVPADHDVEFPRAVGASVQMPPRTKTCIDQRAGNEPAFDLKAELFRIAGIDLTDVPGISTITAHTRLGQTCRGSAMPLLSHPGLGSALRNKSAEGKVRSTRSRKGNNRAPIARPLGAHRL